ncbi:hypothetical protein RJT34_12045 [Clitoria ternatea]|uniref:Uncharacterized protein n=1 Tax=Clitoria ternatea TaxID=43366 RepID=A0AAN9JN24_CLITE
MQISLWNYVETPCPFHTSKRRNAYASSVRPCVTSPLISHFKDVKFSACSVRVPSPIHTPMIQNASSNDTFEISITSLSSYSSSLLSSSLCCGSVEVKVLTTSSSSSSSNLRSSVSKVMDSYDNL